jgi:hypothetical protein
MSKSPRLFLAFENICVSGQIEYSKRNVHQKFEKMNERQETQ